MLVNSRVAGRVALLWWEMNLTTVGSSTKGSRDQWYLLLHPWRAVPIKAALNELLHFICAQFELYGS